MSCNIKQNKTDYYIPETLPFGELEVDQNIIIKAGYLSKIPFLDYKQDIEECSKCVEVYPYVNSYYCHSEDADALSKVNSLLAQPEILKASSENLTGPQASKYDAYSERDAQIQYLESNPVSFIILGKPDIGQQELGKELANYWNCDYIEPQQLIEEEIESGTRAGECIEFNLKAGRAVGIDIILKLVDQRVKSERAKHRGFVLCGLPVIPNDLYEEDPVSSQSAVFTAKDIFEDIFTAVKSISVLPSSPRVSVSSKYKSDVEDHLEIGSSSKPKNETSQNADYNTRENAPDHIEPPPNNQEFNIGKNYEKQLDFLFHLLNHPYFIIYIQCGTIDVLNKRDSYRFDFSSNQVFDTQRRSYNHIFRNILIEENEFDLLDEIFDPTVLRSEDFRLKYLVKLPRDFKATVSSQLENYHYAALNFIQNRILAHIPEYFVKVDGRTSVPKMLSILKAKLKVMNVQQVLIPNKLTDNDLDRFLRTDDTLLEEDQDTPRHGEDEKEPTPEECFKQLRKLQAPSRLFIWSWSEWGTKCPVSMKFGFNKDGNVKYPVQFMNKIYFLADQDAYLKFYQNPRPFLLPPFPRPTCRIFIFGPKRSGRSALAQCLAIYLGGSVLSTDDLLHEYMKQQEDEYLEKIRQQSITEGIALLNENRKAEAEEKEKMRIEQIKDWVKQVVNFLQELSNLLDEIEKEENKEKFEISSFPMAMKKVQTTDVLEDSEFYFALSKLREQIHELNVPIYKLDVQTWKSFITADRRKLLQYLPPDLAQKHQPKPATVFDEFVKEYVDAALANAGLNVQLSGGSIMEMFITHMKNAEEKYKKQGFARGGWVIDGMLCNLKLLQDFFPDHTADDIIVLQDSSNFLVDNYETHNNTFFRDFRNFFMSIGMSDAAWRSPSLTSTQKYKQGLTESILSEILENECFYENAEGIEDSDHVNKRKEEYENEIIYFKQEWAEVRRFYLDNHIIPTEIEISGKSLPDLFIDAIKYLEDKHRYLATCVTQEDRTEEAGDIGHDEVETYSDGERTTIPDQKLKDSVDYVRRYGDTMHFCPVTFSENFVLWKGNENYAVKYNEKMYLLASDPDMQKFLKDPRKFLPLGYPEKFPPPRICVIGASGCGKTRLSKALSENYGLIYVNYEKTIKDCFRIFTNETLDELSANSTRPVLWSYLNTKESMPDIVLANLKMYWFEEPFRSQGFVFDDFPRNHKDVDVMVKNKLIPDVILKVNAEETYLKTKFLERHLKSWQETVDKQHQEIELKHSHALAKWREQRSIRFHELIEERRERRYNKSLQARQILEPQADSLEIKSSSLVSFDSVADQKDIDEINSLLDLELPPMVYNVPLQTPDSFISKMEPLIDSRIQSDIFVINGIKEKCLQVQVPFTEIPLNLDQFDKTVIAASFIVEPLKFRTRSSFECCYNIQVEEAEKLLSSGHKFLSKFGKTCPVQYYENEIPIQMYQMAENSNNLFPVNHRDYIYFIVGDERRELFKIDPLKYINQEYRFFIKSYKIAVTGPPKCGKTILCKRIENELGFKLLTRGQAARYVLKYLFESDLAKNMESVLRKGWELTDEMIIKSVEAATLDSRVISQGVVFDGFPNSLNETKHMAFMDLIPNIVIDLQATDQEIFECLSNDVSKLNLPKFSPGFITHLHEEWLKEADNFREWFDKEYQAMTKIPINTSNWSVWSQSKKYILSTIFEINHYCSHIKDDWPLRLANMLVTPLEFLERQSPFKSLCPVCLHISNLLVTGGDPSDRSGLVQYRNYFYWLCDNHIDSFLKMPEIYLPPYNKHEMPAFLPRRLTCHSIPNNLYEDGACAVCYKTKRIITKGKLTLASSLNEKSYLFDSVECLNTFLRSPYMYLSEIQFCPPVLPQLKYRELPVLGMLEQYLATYIVKGLNFIAKRRPVISGLDISTSALVGLGLFIKVKNDIPNPLKSYYEEGLRLYNERRETLLKYLDLMKTYRNPYVHYEEPLPQFELPPPTPKSESLTTMVSRIVDQCVDNIDLYVIKNRGTALRYSQLYDDSNMID